MENKALTIDRTRLTPEQRSQLATFEHNKKQIQALEDIASMTQEVVNLISDQREAGDMDRMGALLLDIRESLQIMKDKEDPETPDNSKVIVDAVTKMENSLSTAIKAIEVKPQVKVDAPQVNVSPPSVDLKGIEKAFTKSISEVSKGVKDAISNIPQAEKADYTPLLEAWQGISEQLLSIETATRMKPLPGSMSVNNNVKVINPNSTYIGNPLLTKPYDNIIITYTDSTKSVISTIVTKLNGVTQDTVTNTPTATVDDLVVT